MTVFFTKMIFRQKGYLVVDCRWLCPPDPGGMARRLLSQVSGACGERLIMLCRGGELRCFDRDGLELPPDEAARACADMQLRSSIPAGECPENALYGKVQLPGGDLHYGRW